VFSWKSQYCLVQSRWVSYLHHVIGTRDDHALNARDASSKRVVDDVEEGDAMVSLEQ
jgi:hypothetical protein